VIIICNYQEIEEFIQKFKAYEKDGVLEKTFMQGWCYWFGAILTERFCTYDAEMFYEPVQGHFVTLIGGRYYDIRGDVTDEIMQYKELYSEEVCHDMPSIVNGCILKTGGVP
jgi:hypothetical protein